MKLSVFITTAGLFLAMSGCHTSTSPQGSGTIAGRVILFDSTGSILTDFSGIRVSIDGTTKSTLTDSLGNWQLSGLSEGMYDVSATKDGFGTYHFYEQNVNNGRLDEGTAAVAQMPSYTPTISNTSFPGQSLNVGILGEGNGQWAIALWSQCCGLLRPRFKCAAI